MCPSQSVEMVPVEDADVTTAAGHAPSYYFDIDFKEHVVHSRALELFNLEEMSKSLGASPEEATAFINDAAKQQADALSSKAGVEVSLGTELVLLRFDAALQCLDIANEGTLYPIAAFAQCIPLPRNAGGANWELVVCFHNLEALTFRFASSTERVAFALALRRLAAEARKLDKWHEDGEGWDRDTDDDDDDEVTQADANSRSSSTPSWEP